MQVTKRILTINAGSSSLKFALFEVEGSRDLSLLSRGSVDTGHGDSSDPSGHDRATFATLVDWVEAHGRGERLDAIGHRVVHGGPDLAGPALVSDDLLARLDSLASLAPLHQPHNLASIRAAVNAWPGVPQVACFDTAFHRGRARETTRFALPAAFAAEGIERYGFHGLSYEYIAGALPTELASARIIVAHLGSGASLCGLRNGKSVDTTMSFTPLDGVPMATRCGAIDPGVLLYLMRARGMNAEDLEDLLYHRSGLLGVSGVSSDMRVLLSSEEPGAIEAIELFAFRVAREIGALAASLGGLEALVFTAGIGQHSPEIRRRICTRSEWLGVKVADAANARGDVQISAPESRVAVLVIPTDEEAMIARHTMVMVGANR